MLATALPPIPLRDWITEGEMAEAFAYCYLASYAHNVIPARVLTCFERAYGQTNIYRFPRVLNTSPNILVAQIPYPWGNRVIIAIEGTSNAVQLFQETMLSALAAPTATPAGRVVSFFAGIATAAATAMSAIPPVLALLSDPRSEITVTGYSLGAGIAEVMAATMQYLAPTRKIRLRTFAKPRVGNAEWVRNRPAQMSIRSIYRFGDMVHSLPNDGIRVHSIGPISGMGVPTFYVADPESEYWVADGLGRESIPAVTTYDQLRFAANYFRTVTPSNPIYQHVMNSYRHMMCNRLSRQRDLDAERFLNLEYPDDNKWQSVWVPGQTWEPTWIELLDPPPAAIELAQPEEAQLRLHNATPQPANPPTPPLLRRLDPNNSNAVPLTLQLQRRRNRHAPAGAN